MQNMGSRFDNYYLHCLYIVFTLFLLLVGICINFTSYIINVWINVINIFVNFLFISEKTYYSVKYPKKNKGCVWELLYVSDEIKTNIYCANTVQKMFPIMDFFSKVTKSAVSWGFGHIYWRNP